MGGMAAQIPIKNDREANEAALARVRSDKLREVWAGHDGTWVAHPGLVPVAKFVFDTYMPFANQLERTMSSDIEAGDLLCAPTGAITYKGLQHNLDVGLQYLAAWVGGNGCVPIYDLMEDAATAEICRAQIWQWMRHNAKIEGGETVSWSLVGGMIDETVEKLRSRVAHDQLTLAKRLYVEMLDSPTFPEFLTLRAYDYLE